MPKAAAAGAESPDPAVHTENGQPGPPQPTAAERAASARQLADEAAQAAHDAELTLAFTRDHAAGMIAGAEQALADAQDAAEAAEDAAAAAGQEG